MQNPELSKILSPLEGGRNSNSVKSFLTSKRFMVAVIIVQLVIIVLLINPLTIIAQIQNTQLINEVASKVKVNTQETPVIAVISDAKTLRDQNVIQAEIYKNAQNGDYVLGYSDKMVIYRRQDGSIIYEGDSPQTKLQKTEQDIIEGAISAAKAANLIDVDSSETPQYSQIGNAANLRKENPTFYKDAKNGDYLVFFSEAGKVVIYRRDSKTIINSGAYQTAIQ